MEAFAGYESDVESTQAVDADDIQVSDVDITGSQEYGEALPGTQEYDGVELAESVYHIVRPEDAIQISDDEPPRRSRSRSRSVGRGPPIPTADELPPLPPKPAKKRGRRLVPRSTPPGANYGWDITRTVRAINRCQLPGRWYQGGQNDRITYTNDEQSYYIHQQSNSMWVQGREDAVVNARLLASVARDDDSARPWAARAR